MIVLASREHSQQTTRADQKRRVSSQPSSFDSSLTWCTFSFFFLLLLITSSEGHAVQFEFK